MKTTDLMIGDWVRCSDPTPFKIVSIMPDDGYSVVTGDDGFDVCVGDLEPISLTKEILEKNGFKPFSVDIGGWYIEDDYYYIHIIEWSDSIWVFKYKCKEIRTPITECTFGYVHELQHALRLCGLDEIADNFKIN